MSVKTDPRVDEKIAAAPVFARPILAHLRRFAHTACPDTEETIKWGMPFFLYRDKPLCHMGIFKEHCAFGFWHPAMKDVLAREGLAQKMDDSAGLFGKIKSLADLPEENVMLRLIKEAMPHNESGKPARPRPPAGERKPEAAVPADLRARLASNARAAETFHGFSPSHRREYIEWINEAKRQETREKRLASTLELLTEGKPRHWKHQLK